MEAYKQVSFLAMIVFHDLAFHLDLAETIRLIQIANRCGVAGELLRTETSARTKCRGLQPNTTAQYLITEIVVVHEGDPQKPPAGAAFHTVGDDFSGRLTLHARASAIAVVTCRRTSPRTAPTSTAFLRWFHGSHVTDIGVEIAISLKIVAQVAPSFLEQIFI